jgi:hypothetical protein
MYVVYRISVIKVKYGHFKGWLHFQWDVLIIDSWIINVSWPNIETEPAPKWQHWHHGEDSQVPGGLTEWKQLWLAINLKALCSPVAPT